MPLNDETTRRNVIRGMVAAGTVSAFGTATASSRRRRKTSAAGAPEAMRELVEEHGPFQVRKGVFVDDGERVVDTAGERYSGYSEGAKPDSVHFIQKLRFDDGYRTEVATKLELDDEQVVSALSEDESPSGAGELVNTIEGDEFRKEFEFESLREKTEKAKAELSDTSIEREVDTTEVRASDISGDTWSTSEAEYGSTDIDNGIPIINSVGANYKESDARCGVSQRSAYLTFEASASAEVYNSEYLDYLNAGDITATFEGNIKGVISSIGMGGYVQAEGFVRNVSTNNEESTLLMDADVGVAEIPFVTGNGDVDSDFGPDSGTVGDQSYLDYDLDMDLDSGIIDVGVRMNVAFNGLKGGVTQTNFMPQEQWYQPPNLGTEYDTITIDL